MKITVSQLRKIIREEVEKTYSQHKKDGWPSCEEPGCSGKMKPNPQSGNKTSLYCSKCGSEKKKAIKLEALTRSAPLKDGGVVNRDSGEILDMDSVPPQYLDHVEVDEMGYTTLPNDKFEELRGELKGLSAGKPKKQRLAPFQINRMHKR